MKFEFAVRSDPGLIQSENQDAYYTDPDGRFFIVASCAEFKTGGGEAASSLVVQTIQTYLNAQWATATHPAALLDGAFLAANQALLERQTRYYGGGELPTSALAVILHDRMSFCAHSGNCRLYGFDNVTLQQLTEDHTWIARAVKIGDITPEEARIHPFRTTLVGYLGTETSMQVEITPLDTNTIGNLLLCTDGLTQELPDTSIGAIIHTNPVLKDAAAQLIEATNNNGGQDNITVILLRRVK